MTLAYLKEYELLACYECGGELVPCQCGEDFVCYSCGNWVRLGKEIYKDMSLRKLAELCEEFKVEHKVKIDKMLLKFRKDGLVEVYFKKL
jgi:hypothetical protein